MLHSLTNGSKKSFVAKAACLTAGLVAVFASSGVLADQGAELHCRVRTGVSAGVDPGVGATYSEPGRFYGIEATTVGGEPVYTIAAPTMTNRIFYAGDLSNCEAGGMGVTVKQKPRGTLDFTFTGTGNRVVGITTLITK